MRRRQNYMKHDVLTLFLETKLLETITTTKVTQFESIFLFPKIELKQLNSSVPRHPARIQEYSCAICVAKNLNTPNGYRRI